MKSRSAQASKEKTLMQKVIEEGGRLIIELQRRHQDASRLETMSDRYHEAIRRLDDLRLEMQK